MPDALDHDALIARLRAADPAARLDDPSPDGRATVLAARRRRFAGQVRRAGVAGGSVAAAGVVAVSLMSLGGAAGVAPVIVRAAEASEPEPGSILRVTSEVKVVSDGAFALSQRKTTWVRVDQDGRAVDVRTLITDAEGRGVRPVEEVTRATPSGPVFTSRDLQTGEVRTVPGTREVPSVVFRAHELLEAGRTGQGEVRDAGTTTVDGREAHRIVVTGVQGDPVRAGDHDELLVDAVTSEPVALRKHSESVDARGRPHTYDFEERVIDQVVLPDDAAHREQLAMRGPTR